MKFILLHGFWSLRESTNWLTDSEIARHTHTRTPARYKIESMCFRLTCDCLLYSRTYCFILFFLAQQKLLASKQIGSSEKYSNVDRPIFTLIFIDVATNYLNLHRTGTEIQASLCTLTAISLLSPLYAIASFKFESRAVSFSYLFCGVYPLWY